MRARKLVFLGIGPWNNNSNKVTTYMGAPCCRLVDTPPAVPGPQALYAPPTTTGTGRKGGDRARLRSIRHLTREIFATAWAPWPSGIVNALTPWLPPSQRPEAPTPTTTPRRRTRRGPGLLVALHGGGAKTSPPTRNAGPWRLPHDLLAPSPASTEVAAGAPAGDESERGTERGRPLTPHPTA